MQKLSLGKDKIKILLLEGIHQNSVNYFNEQGYTSVETMPAALNDDELAEAIKGVHILGIRSRTQVSKEIIQKADKLITVGYSINGKQQEINGKNAYREHIVPCTLIERKAIEMFKSGNTVEQVAEMIKSNLFILRISDEEAYKLDIELGLRTVMPEGWDFGQDVYSRITFAGIQLEG